MRVRWRVRRFSVCACAPLLLKAGHRHPAEKRIEARQKSRVFARLVIPRRCIPRIKDHNVRFESGDCSGELGTEILALKAHSKRRRWANQHVIFQSITIQIVRIFQKTKFAVFRLDNEHREALR